MATLSVKSPRIRLLYDEDNNVHYWFCQGLRSFGFGRTPQLAFEAYLAHKNAPTLEPVAVSALTWRSWFNWRNALRASLLGLMFAFAARFGQNGNWGYAAMFVALSLLLTQAGTES